MSVSLYGLCNEGSSNSHKTLDDCGSMINELWSGAYLERSGRGLTYGTISRHLLGWTKEAHRKNLDRVCGPEQVSEPWNSRVRGWSAIQSTATFCSLLRWLRKRCTDWQQWLPVRNREQVGVLKKTAWWGIWWFALVSWSYDDDQIKGGEMDGPCSIHMDEKCTILENLEGRDPFRRPGLRCEDTSKMDPK